ncbi:LuxR C-terminal-related transcriptional regulator [Actinomadura rugatobispora]|uniref:LuxR C-terminal-related transcriptional regulator n=1 Tax=Actinomadura rugatobispora TaxID=1994 RepID=A0ABW1AHG1_9ACTN
MRQPEPPAPPRPGGWPFVGRAAEVAAVRSALLDSTRSGVVVVGDAGVGKSWLAAKVADDLDPGRNLVVRAKGTQAAARIPYGALAHLLPAGPVRGGEPRLAAPEAGRRLVVAVDDAHSLDPASAELIADLLERGAARLLATARTGARAPSPLAPFWGADPDEAERRVHRLELGPLGHAQTAQLLEAAVGGQVEDAGSRRLWRVTRGNPLFLRELVLAGMLEESGGVWRCAPGPTLTPRLRELIEARIGGVDERERLALEYLALGEPLDEALLHDLTDAAAVGRLTGRDLVMAAGAELRLVHPLYGEAVRAGMGPLATRTRLRRLADAVDGAGLRRRQDVLRLATWRLDSGGGTDPDLLLRAARIAWSGLAMEPAARLAAAALEAYLARPERRPGSAGEAAALLATVLHFADRDGEAETALGEVAGRLLDDRERGLHAGALGLVLAWGLARDGDARAVLAEAAATIGDPAWRRHVLALGAWIDLSAGRVADARGAVERSRELEPAPAPFAAETGAAEALIGAYGGDHARAVAIAAASMDERARWRDEVPIVMPVLAQARTVAHLFAGEVGEGLAATAAGLDLVEEFGRWNRVEASFCGWRAHLHRLRGDLAEAVRWARDGAARIGGRSAMFAGLCFGELASAEAQRGRAGEAEEALRRAEDLARPAWHGVEFSLALARPWVLAARGQTGEAVSAALAAADDAEARGLRGYAMFALHDTVRLGAADRAAARLTALASQMDGPLAPLCAHHATAAAARDAKALATASESFEALGMLLYAAEAAAQGSAAARARTLAERCGNPLTPALTSLAAPQLTSRQREIARLAAQGLSNREIADRLSISIRTVGNHLVMIYERLGTSDRESLARLFTNP